MKTTLTLLLVLVPSVAHAQLWEEYEPMPSRPIYNPNVVPVAPPFGPSLPIPRQGEVNSAGWNTGYSVVTTTRERPDPLLSQIYDRDITTSETVTAIVPNNALGQPMMWRVPGQ